MRKNPEFPPVLSFFFLTFCAILLTSFGGKDWSHSPFIRRSPNWGFREFSSAVRQMPGDLSTAGGIISLSPLSLPIDVTDVTFGASGLWLEIRTGAGGAAAYDFMDSKRMTHTLATKSWATIFCLFLYIRVLDHKGMKHVFLSHSQWRE